MTDSFDTDRMLNLVGGIGFVFGALAVSLLFIAYILAKPLTVPVQCHEDEVILWNDTTNKHEVCVPYDDLPIIEGAIHGEVSHVD